MKKEYIKLTNKGLTDIIKTNEVIRYDLSRENLFGYDLSNKVFTNCIFDKCDLDASKLSNTRFFGCSIKGATFDNARIYETTFNDCQIIDCSFYSSIIYHCSFLNSNLAGSRFSNYEIEYTSFDGSILNEINIRDAKFYHCSFHNSKGIIIISSIGSRGDTLYIVKHKTFNVYKTGCFYGTQDDFMIAVKDRHCIDSIEYKMYMQAIELGSLL